MSRISFNNLWKPYSISINLACRYLIEIATKQQEICTSLLIGVLTQCVSTCSYPQWLKLLIMTRWHFGATYHNKNSKCSPLALTQAIIWSRHCAFAWSMTQHWISDHVTSLDTVSPYRYTHWFDKHILAWLHNIPRMTLCWITWIKQTSMLDKFAS